MDPSWLAKQRCPSGPCLSALLIQLLVAVCLFSYIWVSYDSASVRDPSAQAGAELTPAAPAQRPLRILLWTWPFHIPVALSPCSQILPGTADCVLTPNRNVYSRADAVIFHHRDICSNPRSQLPQSPRPPSQRWVWFNMESPSHSPRLAALDGYFNLTMSYRRDSDVFTPYGWLEPWPGLDVHTQVNLSTKTLLVAWAVSNWNPQSARVRYYEKLKVHLSVDVYGHGHLPLPRENMLTTLARYKFYLAFENSQHQDYITEKLWHNAIQAWAVPVVLGPSRRNYEYFLPPDAFIHVDDFPSPRELAGYLQELAGDEQRYLSYFRWRERLRPQRGSWALAFCKACQKLQWDQRYQRIPSVAAWFT